MATNTTQKQVEQLDDHLDLTPEQDATLPTLPRTEKPPCVDTGALFDALDLQTEFESINPADVPPELQGDYDRLRRRLRRNAD